jgi:spore coat protein CotF
MAITFTQKERMLLEDLKSHEQLCISKYGTYANQAQDPELKQLFNTYAGEEQQHLNTLNQIASGQVPNVGQGQQAKSQATQPAPKTNINSQNDAKLCSDLLMTEKYVASSYNTAIFEFRDTNVRQVLNHIQKEEQQHGEGIFNYMQSKGMYNVQ